MIIRIGQIGHIFTPALPAWPVDQEFEKAPSILGGRFNLLTNFLTASQTGTYTRVFNPAKGQYILITNCEKSARSSTFMDRFLFH